jgi:hypothetical protein
MGRDIPREPTNVRECAPYEFLKTAKKPSLSEEKWLLTT